MRYPHRMRRPITFIHSDVIVAGEAVAIVSLGQQANAMLLDQWNYEAYLEGRLFLYDDGGWSRRTPARLLIPSAGRWHIVIDYFSAPGPPISASIEVIERTSGEIALRKRKLTLAPVPRVSASAMQIERGQPSQALIRRRRREPDGKPMKRVAQKKPIVRKAAK